MKPCRIVSCCRQYGDQIMATKWIISGYSSRTCARRSNPIPNILNTFRQSHGSAIVLVEASNLYEVFITVLLLLQALLLTVELHVSGGGAKRVAVCASAASCPSSYVARATRCRHWRIRS